MSKAVLVMDMPETCGKCKLRLGMMCPYSLKEIESVNTKSDWCPLGPFPEKQKNTQGFGIELRNYKEGWNACLDAIIGHKDVSGKDGTVSEKGHRKG